MAKTSLLHKIAAAVAKLEGKKKQTSIGDIKETIARYMEHLEMVDLDGSMLKAMQVDAKKRLKKKVDAKLAQVIGQLNKD